MVRRHIALALAPDSLDVSPVQARVVSTAEFLDLDLHAWDCVMLANVQRFGPDEAVALRTYLQGGGGLVFFLGDQVQPADYNSQLGAAREGRILPANIGPVVDEAQYWFDPRDYRHPIVPPFQGHERAGLLTTPVWKYMRLRPSGELSAHRGTLDEQR